MTEVIERYPLAWPTGWRRTQAPFRTRAKFGKAGRARQGGGWDYGRQLTIAEGVDRVRIELQRLGVLPDDVVISSNLQLRLDGLPRSNQPEPADPGVAVYWIDPAAKGKPTRCMAIDRYDRVADNLAAVAATVESMRAIERHGGAEILDRAFTGFVALPAPFDWKAVLGLGDHGQVITLDIAEAAYRRLAGELHPDRAGADFNDRMADLNAARASAREALG